jgi:hypothetical protein
MLICNVWENLAACKGLDVAPTYAGILGFLAFATTLAHGWLHGQSADSTVLSALAAMAALAAAGLVLGRIAQGVVDQEVRWRLSREKSPSEETQGKEDRLATR